MPADAFLIDLVEPFEIEGRGQGLAVARRSTRAHPVLGAEARQHPIMVLAQRLIVRRRRDRLVADQGEDADRHGLALDLDQVELERRHVPATHIRRLADHQIEVIGLALALVDARPG